mmetsp:Transcript_1814/g.2902  ORF Transcript_1814/g.2902 Transcript_1814/m.2902 type:complete len:339 (+) Transcript_1814:33-1049(+)
MKASVVVFIVTSLLVCSIMRGFLIQRHPFQRNVLHRCKGQLQHRNEHQFRLFGEEESKEEDEDSTMGIAKLKAEAASPFRLLRLFIYGGIGAAGGLGTFTAVPQLILALNSDDGDKANAITNVLVDVGGVVAAAFLYSKERDNQQKQLTTFTDKQQKMDNKMTDTTMAEREKLLSMLPIEIQISEQDENVTRIVSLQDLQQRGNQHVVLVAGENGFVRDAVIAARLEGSDLFNAKETTVVPFIYNDRQLEEGKEKGFGSKEGLMTSPYIAKPKQMDVWQRILQGEVDLAEQQGTSDVWGQGLVIAITREGKVLRRGLGAPPWQEVVEQLDSSGKKNKK